MLIALLNMPATLWPPEVATQLSESDDDRTSTRFGRCVLLSTGVLESCLTEAGSKKLPWCRLHTEQILVIYLVSTGTLLVLTRNHSSPHILPPT
ncbi:hypothetical protein DAEQUDRAFT_248273 [Daedalea quercina L-15889]|uniref:Uncharacterized protein n=1 Tax=Daedalea quercina L-15889 TaxID=1314783 RepID=A0A165QMB9_9APHY|nr:hypothetical protein DAEQUDRAFT_248273 [Daedalea quercina L-15889]